MFAAVIFLVIVVAVVTMVSIRLYRAATPPGGFRRSRSDGWLGFVTNLLGDNRVGERVGDRERQGKPRDD